MVRRSYDSFDAADFEKCRERIVEILAGASAPITTNEMAGQLQRSYDVAQDYCDRLNSEGKVRYVNASPARWGWVIAP